MARNCRHERGLLRKGKEHGAAADSWFQHIAQEIPGANTSSEWCEPVDDEQYAALEK